MSKLKKHFYTHRDIAKIMGITPQAVLNAIRRGYLDPESLESVIKYSSKHKLVQSLIKVELYIEKVRKEFFKGD